MDMYEDGMNICLETYGFPLGELNQEEYALHGWMMAHPSNVDECGPTQGPTAWDGNHQFSGAPDNAWSSTPNLNPDPAGDMGQGDTPDSGNVSDGALAQAMYTQRFPDGHKPRKSSQLNNHYLGSFEAVEESMKAQKCTLVASAKVLKMIFETNRDEINAGLENPVENPVENGPLLPKQLARVIAKWGQGYNIAFQLGFVADASGYEKPIVQLPYPDHQIPLSQTFFIYKHVTDTTQGAFWTTPWRPLAKRLLIRGSKKPGIIPSPLSAGNQVDQASQQPINGNPSHHGQTIPDFDENDVVKPAAAEELSAEELAIIAEKEYHEAFPGGHMTDSRFCEDRHKSGFIALSYSIAKQRLGLSAATDGLIKSYDNHHAQKELPQRDKNAVLGADQLSQFLLLWGDEHSKLLVLGIVVEIFGKKTQYDLARNFDRTAKDQQIVWVCKEAMSDNIKIDEVAWKGLAFK
ncbi:MAG: hypothetical protein Q9208_002752 [Pyrenodesmia sp. 3 TL-2023]